MAKKAAKTVKAGKASKAKKATSAKAHPRPMTSAPRAPMNSPVDLVGFKKEQFNLRFQQANGQAENTGRIRVLRRNIARIQTILTEQRRASAKA